MHKKFTSGLNGGIFQLGRASQSGGMNKPKTLIVSGLPRSGTSMVARALSKASFFLGDAIDDVVYEDHEISTLLNLQDLVTLRHAIQLRNSRFKNWGFKKPNIHDFINPKHRSLFRNPFYIFTFRDPIAIAGRNIISEAFDGETSLSQVVSMQRLMVEFILELGSPVLLISYEKAIQSPMDCVESVIDFACLRVDETQKQKMVESIEPNRREYLFHARRVFEGSLDCVRGDMVLGWCRQVSTVEPIAVNVLINDKSVVTILADIYREDLDFAGIGAGEHGFCIDVKQFELSPEDTIRVFAHGRSFELLNSGKAIRELRAL